MKDLGIETKKPRTLDDIVQGLKDKFGAFKEKVKQYGQDLSDYLHPKGNPVYGSDVYQWQPVYATVTP